MAHDQKGGEKVRKPMKTCVMVLPLAAALSSNKREGKKNKMSCYLCLKSKVCAKREKRRINGHGVFKEELSLKGLSFLQLSWL